MSTFIDMKSVSQLEDYRFYIPNYQRGYRWAEQQVKELLEDLWEFTMDKGADNTIYCLQPLVVTPRAASQADILESVKKAETWGEVCRLVDENRNVWEVIDGQQRLTTVCIILQALQERVPYVINYDTLGQNNDKIANVKDINDEDTDKDINLFYMYRAYNCACVWLDAIDSEEGRRSLKETILNKVKFIWYQSDEDFAINIFARLNVGRIALTGSELIKALFLNRKNFKDSGDQSRRASQVEIAKKWDEIESQLQDDEFWLFFNKTNSCGVMPTRVDFLLDFLVASKDYLKFEDKDVGNDKYRTFRCYYNVYNKDKETFVEKWKDIQDLYDTLYEWYSNSQLYHYIGYLLAVGKETLMTVYTEWWKMDKANFVKWLRSRAKESIKNCQNLETDYFAGGRDTKREAIPLLLLHNVVTVIRQNEILSKNDKYQMGVFYKFPFHLYKIESWDVEHIDSATPNSLTNGKEQQNWILSTYQCLSDSDKERYKEDVKRFCLYSDDDLEEEKSVTYDALALRLQKTLGLEVNARDESWKNKIYNFTLLDSSTNRSYKNTIFPNKRSYIIGKEKGRLKVVTWNKTKGELEEEEIVFNSAFIPPCTKNVFQKTYSSLQGDITKWTRSDAESYKAELQETIEYITAN